MSWTDERVDLLKKLWAEGRSASQIARELGSVSRNAVIGKVHRLGIAARSTVPKPVRRPRAAAAGTAAAKKAAPAARTPAKTAATPAPQQPAARMQASATPAGNSFVPTRVEIVPAAQAVSLLDLTERTCKWPMGNPGEAEFRFCGAAASAGHPYCEGHLARAYQPTQARRDRPRSGSTNTLPPALRNNF